MVDRIPPEVVKQIKEDARNRVREAAKKIQRRNQIAEFEQELWNGIQARNK